MNDVPECMILTAVEQAKYIGGYIDDSLLPKEKAYFETHLQVCESCRETLALVREARDEEEGEPE